MARKKEKTNDNIVKMKELTKGEEQVMQVIWQVGQGFANEIMAAFPELQHRVDCHQDIGKERFCEA